ncbi:MAG: redoxin domain-containing protein [Bacteroidetes bacterium]|nr:redoxin domain-containing protein [Bacteroidota bacterium]
MKKIFFFLLWLISIAIAENVSANSIFIKYIINKDSSYNRHRESDYLFAIINNGWDILDVNCRRQVPFKKNVLYDKPGKEIVVFEYDLKRDGIYFINDLAGHEVFLDRSMSKDTIVLILDRIYTVKKKLLYLNDSITSPWFYKIKYPERFKYMGFFDSLAYLHGDVKADYYYSFKMFGYDLEKYLLAINKIYTDRINFYNYFIRHFYMPPKIKYYALKEIQYRYYHDLLDPIYYDFDLRDKYPQAMKDTIDNIKNNLTGSDLFENVTWFRTVVIDYVNIMVRGFSLKDKTSPDSSYFINEVQFCKKELKRQSQCYAIAWFMFRASAMNKKDIFLFAYKHYDHKISSIGINEFVDSLYNVVTGSATLSEEDVLNIRFEDDAHNDVILKNVFNRDLIVIDCWATWCAPCRQQMPQWDSLACEYDNRVQFISLSADQFLNKWDDWLSKSNEKNKCVLQLHAKSGFDNIFFRRLMISAIPRYILLSKSGKILNMAMPYPQAKEEFKKEINRYLNE